MAARTAAFAAGGNAARRHEDAWRSFRCHGGRGTAAAALEPPGESWLSLVGPADTILVDEKMGNPVYNGSGSSDFIPSNGGLGIPHTPSIAGNTPEIFHSAASDLAA